MDSITFQVGTPANHQEIIEFLNTHFLPHEPMNISIDLLEPGYRIPFFDAMVSRQLKEAGSLVVLARQRNILMGLAIFVTERDGERAEPDPGLVCPSKLQSIFRFIERMKSELDVSSQYGVTQWAEVEFLVCHSEVRVPGLGTELIRIGTNMLADTGTKVTMASSEELINVPTLQVVIVHASSHFSSQIFRKVGFKEVFSLPFREYQVEGEVVFKTTPPHSQATLFVKSLQ